MPLTKDNFAQILVSQILDFVRFYNSRVISLVKIHQEAKSQVYHPNKTSGFPN